MIMNTDTLAGEVRSTEASGVLSPVLLDWFQGKCRQTLIPATKGGIHPEEHYLWFSRLLQTRGWLKAHVHPRLTLFLPEEEEPEGDQCVVFQDWEKWRSKVRVLKPPEEEEGSWSAPLYRRSGEQVLNLQYNQGSPEPHFKPSRGVCDAHIGFNRPAAWMISGALVGTGLLSTLGERGSWGGTIDNERKRSWGRTLTPEQTKAMAWIELMIALIKTGAEYWEDYFHPLGRALNVLMPGAQEAGFTFRPPENSSYRGEGRAQGLWDQPWAQIIHPLIANSDTYTLKIAAISDFLTRNVDVFMDYIHQEAGMPPLTPLQREESWRAALCGWTTSRGAPPFYGPEHCTERPKGGQPREAPTPLFCDFLREDHNLYRYAE